MGRECRKALSPLTRFSVLPMRTPLLNTLFVWIAMLFMLIPVFGYAREFGSIHHYDTRNGLSSNYVTDIVQDKRGILWIASDAGVNRFDGVNFKPFTLKLDSLTANTVSSILYDKDIDCLWVGTRTGLGKLNCLTGEFKKVNLPDYAWAQNISKIIPASGGGVWVISHYYNLIHIDRNNNVKIYSSENIPDLISSFSTGVDDGRGHLIVGNDYGGLSVLDIASGESRFYDNGDMKTNTPVSQIYDMIVDSRGNIWFSGNHGITLFKPTTEQFFSFSTGRNGTGMTDRIFSLMEDSDGKIWAGGDLGTVNIYDPMNVVPGNQASLRLEKHNVKEYESGTSTGNIKSVFEDSFGNIWFCNYGKGLDVVKHTESLFTRLPYLEAHSSGFDNHDIWSIFADSDGSVFLGGTNTIGIYNGQNQINTVFLPSVLSHKYSRVTALYRRGNDLLIGLYDDGLLKYNTTTGSVSRIDIGLDNLGVNVFLPTDETIMIGCSNGVKVYHDNSISNAENINKVLNGLSVTGIVKDRKGNIWVGTYGAGVIIFDSKFNKLNQIEGKELRGGTVKQLYTDSRGWIWIITKEGIAVVRKTHDLKSLQLISYPSIEHPTILRGIVEDSWGNMWVSTDFGLIEWEQNTGNIRCFRAASSDTFSNFNDRAIAVDSYGRILLGSGDGVWVFNPSKVESNQLASKVAIIECVSVDTEADKAGRILIPSDNGELKVKYHDSSFSIVFAVPDVAQSEEVEYEVMLEGLDETWCKPIRENHVTYRRLPPGNYTFKVRARLPHQQWNDANIATLEIFVEHPFWTTWWAIALYIGIIVLCILLWVKYYRRRIQRQGLIEVKRKNDENERELNSERLRFYTNITHELRTPLTLILGPLEDLLADNSMPQKYKSRITTIHTSAQRLLNLVNQILEFRKVETQNRKLCVSKGHLGNVITELGLRFKELYHNDDVTVEIDVHDNGELIYFDQDIITSVVSNFLSNAMKYTPKGTIRLSLQNVEQNGVKYAEISVEDTGYGIDSAVLPHIFDRYYQARGNHQASGSGIGLALVKSLAEVHGGTLSVDSVLGKGSTFRFRILTDCIYPDALHSNPQNEVRVEIDPESNSDDQDKRPLILIVEDNNDIRNYVIDALSDSFRLIGAGNGREGYEQAVKNNPDIIVSDLMMPVMDGIQMLKKIKKDESTSHIPVILLTAKDSMLDKEIGYENGADSYLTKPFSAKLLKSRIENILVARKKLVSLLTTKAAAGKEQRIDSDSDTSGVGEVRLSKIDREFLDKFTSLIEDNITHPNLDMSFIQNELSMSRSTLYRKIKGITGMSGNEFIRKVKLRHALVMLRDGYGVSEASYSSGFNDVAYFRDCFKEEYGDTPTGYIKKSKADGINESVSDNPTSDNPTT